MHLLIGWVRGNKFQATLDFIVVSQVSLSGRGMYRAHSARNGGRAVSAEPDGHAESIST